MMMRVRFTEGQIIAVLREHEAGAKPGDPARKHGLFAPQRKKYWERILSPYSLRGRLG